MYGRFRPLPLPSGHNCVKRRARSVGELIHCDIFGPTRTPSVTGGYRYWITFIDDYSRRLWVYLLLERKHAVRAFQQFVCDFAAAPVSYTHLTLPTICSV